MHETLSFSSERETVETMYQSTFNLCGSLLMIVFFGFIYGLSNHYKQGHVIIINNIVFFIILPCHIFSALRKQDWLDSEKEWEFIASFLVLRQKIKTRG